MPLGLALPAALGLSLLWLLALLVALVVVVLALVGAPIYVGVTAFRRAVDEKYANPAVYAFVAGFFTFLVASSLVALVFVVGPTLVS